MGVRESIVGFLSKLFGGSGEKRVDIRKRFELIGRTGTGSMSKVWRARDRKLGRVICLKLLDREKTAKFEERFKGLKRPSEGAVCMSLRHKNVVQTYEYGVTTDREPFLIMEGFLKRTSRGRVATPLAYEHLGFGPAPAGQRPDDDEVADGGTNEQGRLF